MNLFDKTKKSTLKATLIIIYWQKRKHFLANESTRKVCRIYSKEKKKLAWIAMDKRVMEKVITNLT